jgi:type I restriction enzyme S subunit
VRASERTLTPEGLEEAKPLPKGAVLFTCIGATIGKSGIAARQLATNQQINAIICDPDKADPEFVYYLLALRAESIKRIAGAQAVPLVNKSTFEDVTAPFPPLSEQRKIAEILRTWDEAIDACERLIERLKARQAALVHQLVFGQRRLGNYAQSNDMQKVRWLSVPADWQVVSIGSIAAERSELNRNGDSAEVLSCSKYDGFVRSLDYFKKQVFSSDLSGYKVIRRGDFGFPSNHVEEGSIGLQNLVDEGLVSPIYTVFRFDEKQVDNDYAYGVLKTELYRHIFQVSTSASVDRRGSLRWSDFSTLPFPLPSIDEQRAIQAVLANGQAQIDGQVAERNSLQAQKRGLMQKLLTGEWRLKVDEEAAA